MWKKPLSVANPQRGKRGRLWWGETASTNRNQTFIWLGWGLCYAILCGILQYKSVVYTTFSENIMKPIEKKEGKIWEIALSVCLGRRNWIFRALPPFFLLFPLPVSLASMGGERRDPEIGEEWKWSWESWKSVVSSGHLPMVAKMGGTVRVVVYQVLLRYTVTGHMG